MFTGVMCNPKQTPVTNGRPGDTLTEDSQDDSFSGGGFYAVYPKTNGRPGDTLAEDSQDDSFSGGCFNGVPPEINICPSHFIKWVYSKCAVTAASAFAVSALAFVRM